MTTTAIIGTAGRDKTKPMGVHLYKWMVHHARTHIPIDADLVSGGAAWADHVAVSLFLFGHGRSIRLHLPAPFFNGKFVENGHKSAGGIANYYHGLFSQAIGRDTLGQLNELIQRSLVGDTRIHIECEPASPGLGGMFARNKKVSVVNEMWAYTFGEGDVPADGGTKNTWDLCAGKKTHVSLPYFY